MMKMGPFATQKALVVQTLGFESLVSLKSAADNRIGEGILFKIISQKPEILVQ